MYPDLGEESGSNFRLTRCCEVLTSLEREAAHYDKVRKKYGRARNVMMRIATVTGFTSITLSAGGLGTGLTGVGLPIGISLGALGGIFGLVSVGCGMVTKKLSLKVSKHEKTETLARAKIATISDLISKALSNNEISESEFSIITLEVEKFESQKRGIRRKFMDEEKKPGLARPREEVRGELLRGLSTTRLA